MEEARRTASDAAIRVIHPVSNHKTFCPNGSVLGSNCLLSPVIPLIQALVDTLSLNRTMDERIKIAADFFSFKIALNEACFRGMKQSSQTQRTYFSHLESFVLSYNPGVEVY